MDVIEMARRVNALENGEMTDEEVVELFQSMIDDGSIWKFQGSYGRMAMDLITNGSCILGKHGNRDYYGNYIPSRTEVEPGTKGSVEFQNKMRGRRCHV